MVATATGGMAMGLVVMAMDLEAAVATTALGTEAAMEQGSEILAI